MIQTEIVKEIVRLQAATAYTVTITKLKPQRKFNSFLVRKRLKNQCKLQGQHQIQIKRLTFLDLLVRGKNNFLLKLVRDRLYIMLAHVGDTGCVSLNENPTKFKIVKEPLLIQK